LRGRVAGSGRRSCQSRFRDHVGLPSALFFLDLNILIREVARVLGSYCRARVLIPIEKQGSFVLPLLTDGLKLLGVNCVEIHLKRGGRALPIQLKKGEQELSENRQKNDDCPFAPMRSWLVL